MEAEDDLFDGYPLSSTEAASGPDKRKVESGFGLFCVMRKKARGDISADDDDMSSSDFDYASEKGEDFCCSDSDTDLSECSEFDVISQHVVEEKGLIGSESPCLSEDDGGNEVRCGDVVNVQRCMEKVSCNDEPILSSSIPPDGGSSGILLDRCLSEYNVHSDEFGLGISPVPLTKTLEGHGRPWSVCGSIAAVRNIPLLGDSSGACKSLGEQLDVNVSAPEGRDAELSKTIYQEEDVDGEVEISFSDIDAMIRRLNLIPDDSDSCFDMEERNMSKHPRHTLLGLEHCSVTLIPRGIISQGAIAVLHCRGLKHFIRKQEVIIGRSSDGMNVDIDLGKYGYGNNISRRQALVELESNGSFSLKNLGK